MQSGERYQAITVVSPKAHNRRASPRLAPETPQPCRTSPSSAVVQKAALEELLRRHGRVMREARLS
ncbi:MAG: hypothetical protein ABSH28_15775 [Acidobacteriota bacterium]